MVVILADDMGYGDIHAFNPNSTIPTPNLDRIAAEGMTFTDAHSPSSVCTPTRYGLLTGRYAWRTQLKKGVLGGYSPPLLAPGRKTVADLLKKAGYRTCAIGKWHLGMTLPTKPGRRMNLTVWEGDPGINFGGVITDSPIHHGFDSYFGVSASLDMAPYVYIRDDRFAAIPDLEQPAVPFPHFVREGPRSSDFVIDEVLDRLTEEAIQFIQKAKDREEPFFLYLALTGPHKPTQPHERFRGKTKLGEYGDFVSQVDWTVGEVLKVLDQMGISENTLLLYTSDNGSYMNAYDDTEQSDHVEDSSQQGYFPRNHQANGSLRGTKADIWEGGHRVPLLAHWPTKVGAASKSDATVCLTDFTATLAALIGVEIPDGTAEDSYSFAPALFQKEFRRAAPVVHHSAGGMFAIRSGKWNLVTGDGSGGRQKPVGDPFGKPYQLFNLEADLGEKSDVASGNPDVVERLVAEFEQIRDQ
ncbi:MAG: arylsulfatase [Acidobacteriota bacterium]|nr:MAG: arylsulfatase [Acidobacteriota bacterium]